jgi:hypothetical protein
MRVWRWPSQRNHLERITGIASFEILVILILSDNVYGRISALKSSAISKGTAWPKNNDPEIGRITFMGGKT